MGVVRFIQTESGFKAIENDSTWSWLRDEDVIEGLAGGHLARVGRRIATDQGNLLAKTIS